MRERKVGLGHADRQRAEPGALELERLRARERRELDPARSVGARRDRLELAFNRFIEAVEEARARADGGRLPNDLGQLGGAGPALLEAGVDGDSGDSELAGEPPGSVDLFRHVAREAVDGDHAGEPEGLDNPEVRLQVRDAALEPLSERGVANLQANPRIVEAFGRSCVIAVNRFQGDVAAEIDAALRLPSELGVAAVAVNAGFEEGGAGAAELAEIVREAASVSPRPRLPLPPR